MANTLRAKIRKAAEDGAIEEIKADAEIVKLMQAMDDLEKKCKHFSHVNNYKFCQVSTDEADTYLFLFLYIGMFTYLIKL